MKRFWFIVLVFSVMIQGVAQESDTLVCRGRLFISREVPEEVQNRMIGKSMPESIPIPFEELRYLTLPYFDFNGEIQTGEMVCNKSIAEDLLFIFKALFRLKYPINSIRLIDDFDGDDEASMQANNTSCFNYRKVQGINQLSNHAYGKAVDINPLQNPWVPGNQVHPSNAKEYADRSKDFPHKIDHNDPCYILFKSRGFFWGGDWSHSMDYQHFHKTR